MFTLGRPDIQGVSQALGSIGGGLSDALLQYINNKRFQSALGGIQPGSSAIDVLNRFAQNQVSPQQQEMFFSPLVQQRLAQQRGRETLEKIRNLPQGSNARDYISLLAQAAQENPQGMAGFEPLINFFVNQAQAGVFGNQEGPADGSEQESTAGPDPVRPSQRQGDVGPRKQFTARKQTDVGALPGFMQDEAATDPRQVNPFETFARPVPGSDFLKSRTAQLMKEGIPRDVAVNQANQELQADIQQRASQREDIQQSAAGRETQLGIDKEIQNATDEMLTRNFGGTTEAGGGTGLLFNPQIEPLMRQIATQLMSTTGGSFAQREPKVVRKLQAINNGWNAITGAEEPPIAGGIRRKAYADWLDRAERATRPAVELVPEGFKRESIQRAKSLWQAKGAGNVDSEYIANRPSDNARKLIESIPAMPKLPPKLDPSRAIVPGSKMYATQKKEYEKDVEKNVNRAAKTITEISARDPWASPFIVRNRMLDKGYTEDQVKRAYELASRGGARFSPYQQEQIAQLAQPENPSLEYIFTGERPYAGFWDIYFRGTK